MWKKTLVTLTCLFLTNTALALGRGEYSVAARDGNNRLKGEVRILLRPGGASNQPAKLCGKMFYVSNYANKEYRRWVGRGWYVNVEFVSLSGRRGVLCNIWRMR